MTMKPINIYALTRIEDPDVLSKAEKQMSKRSRPIRIKAWEIGGLKLLSEKLCECLPDAFMLKFYYSYTMQRLGKEFDLLRIGEDYIVNIELKSGNVSHDMIRKQLLQNKYYLSTLGKNVYYYTYIDSQDMLLRLSNSGKLVNSSFEEQAMLLDKQLVCYEGDIEELFKEDKYLISPITDPGKFLRQEYFLTFQQRDIRKQILKRIGEGHMIQGFTGIPGTGKTLLLYDIAMQLSKKNPVCLFHFGRRREELMQLDERLKRIDFYYCEGGIVPGVAGKYAAIFVDEGHGMGTESFELIRRYSAAWNAPVVISYDNVDCVSERERIGIGAPVIESCEDFIGYKLTNRIRLNSELSTFLRVLFSATGTFRRDYPGVSVSYGKDLEEAMNIVRFYEEEGYIFIWDKGMDVCKDSSGHFPPSALTSAECGSVTGKEYDKVVMLLDDSFYYDDDRFLRNRESDTGSGSSRIMNLFHGLSRAKDNIALVIISNKQLLDRIYYILQK